MKYPTALLLGALHASAVVLPRSDRPAKFLVPGDDVKAVDDEFIVVLQKGHTLEDHFKVIGQDLSKTCDLFWPIETINGYRVRLDPRIVHDHIRYDPSVAFVEQDHIVEPIIEHSSGEKFIKRDTWITKARRLARRWGYGWQIDKRPASKWHNAQATAGRKLDVPMNWDNNEFDVLDGAGKGVNIYVLDSGVRLDHDAFRTGGGASNFHNMEDSKYVSARAADNHGHGTHVASIAAGQWSGMAPWAHIINVKVLCSGENDETCRPTNGGIAQAISDVTNEHVSNKNNRPDGWKGSVINMSLRSGSNLEALRLAMAAAKVSGVPIATTSGNTKTGGIESKQAPCAFTESCVCVSSNNVDYKLSWFAGWGANVDMFAPGEDISGADSSGKSYWVRKSGTSMAAPHVAGIMAIYIGYEGIDSDVDKVMDRLEKNGISDIIEVNTNPPTRNFMANSGINNPNREAYHPYLGPPGRELKMLAMASEGEAGEGDIGEDPTPSVPIVDEESGPGFTTLGTDPGSETQAPVVTEQYIDPIETQEPTNGDPYEGDEPEVGGVEEQQPTTTTEAPSGPTLCQGNQVQKDCVPGILPSAAPFSGQAGPSCMKADGSEGADARINDQAFKEAAAGYCKNLVDGKVVMSKDGGSPSPAILSGQAEGGKAMVINILYAQQYCPIDKSKDTLAFADLGYDKCVMYLYESISMVCSQDKTWTAYNKDFTVEGGVYANDCGMFSVYTQ